MHLIKSVISNYRTIIANVSKYTTYLPPHARERLAIWLIYEIIIRKPGIPPPGRKLSPMVQRLIENQVAIYAGYMVIFAHDDAVDKYNLQTEQIYDQLSRCLAAFLLGLLFDIETATGEDLIRELQRWLGILRERLSEHPLIVKELPYLLEAASIWDGIPPDKKITVQDILIKHGYKDLCREWLNASIVSALGMGQAFRTLSALLRQYLGESKNVQQLRYEYYLKILTQCMYAQAHSPEQKSWDAIRYDRFIELAYMKSTILIDLYHYVSDQVNERRFFATRHNASRACDQIFDDLKDYQEDTQDQVLGILHMHILEQGRLAEKFLSIPNRQYISIKQVEGLISDTKILRISYDNTLIYHNPYVFARRDFNGNLRMEPDEAETILREIWVNSPAELKWSIEKLAMHRAALAREFKSAWLARDVSSAVNILLQSNFPMALSRSFSRFTLENKRIIIRSYTDTGAPRAGYVGYYAVVLGLNALWLNFGINRMIQSFLAPKFFRLHSRRGSHGNQNHPT